jgi:hypothetical protein
MLDLYGRITVDDWMWQAYYGEKEPDPTAWEVLRCDVSERPFDIESAAEVVVENHLYDGADHPSCNYVEVWMRPMVDPDAWALYRVDLDFDISFSASRVR